MNYTTVLEKLENNEITPELAYKDLYDKKRQKPGKRAFFIKLRINVPSESARLNTFLKVLFAIPIPIVFARLGLSLANRFAGSSAGEIDFSEISRLIKYSKNTRINIESEDANVDIKIM